MKITKKGFTLVELLIVIAVLIVLTVVAIYVLNPSQLQSQGRDSNRLSDMTTLNQQIALYHEVQPTGSLGSSNIIYISVPDPAATTTAGTDCSSLGFPAGEYHCAASSTYRNIDGTGWIPVNFAAAANGNFFATLPIDPINTATSGEYYEYVASGTLYGVIAGPEASKTIDSSESSSFVQGNYFQSCVPGTGLCGSVTPQKPLFH